MTIQELIERLKASVPADLEVKEVRVIDKNGEVVMNYPYSEERT